MQMILSMLSETVKGFYDRARMMVVTTSLVASITDFSWWIMIFTSDKTRWKLASYRIGRFVKIAGSIRFLFEIIFSGESLAKADIDAQVLKELSDDHSCCSVGWPCLVRRITMSDCILVRLAPICKSLDSLFSVDLIGYGANTHPCAMDWNKFNVCQSAAGLNCCLLKPSLCGCSYSIERNNYNICFLVLSPAL